MLQFSRIQERLFATALAEAEKRKEGGQENKSTGASSGIESFLPKIKAKLSAISASYQVMALSNPFKEKFQVLQVSLKIDLYINERPINLVKV